VSSSFRRIPAEFFGRRVQGIDLLRGLCIVAVVLHHINLRIRFNHSNAGHFIGPAANNVLFWNGYYGVRVFFVISGFLITAWSLQRWGQLEELDLKSFYRMRFARIAPSLLGLLLVLSLCDLIRVPLFTIQHTTLPRALLAALTFHVNWLEAKSGYLPAGWDVLWSLSVEEVLYFVFPLLCKTLRSRFLLTCVLLSFVVLGPFVRVLTHNPLWSDYGYLSCTDGIAIGCLAAMLAGTVKLSRAVNLGFRVAGCGMCLLIAVFRGAGIRFYKIGLDVTVLEVGTALLVIAMQQGEQEQSKGKQLMSRFLGMQLLGRVLRWFGRNSYEVYLTHMLVVLPVVMLYQHLHAGINTAPGWFLGATTLAGLAGFVAAKFYSEPLNRRLRARVGRASSRAAVAASTE